MTPKSGQALLGCNSLLQPAKIRQVLEIENVAVAFGIPRTQRRNADAQITDLARRRVEVNFLSKREPLAAFVMTGEPEIVIQILKPRAAHFREAMSKNFFSGTIQ